MRIILLICLLILSNIVFALAQTRNLEKFEPEEDMVFLEKLNGKVNLKIGQKAYFQFSIYGSVGISGVWDIDDETIFKKVDEHLAYEKVHIEGRTGDDRATGTIVLEALKAGKINFIFKEMFRGEVRSKYEIKIRVE